MNKKRRTKIVILAAGKGTRMKHDLPKALIPVRGMSMIKHLLLSVSKFGIDDMPVIVVGYEKEKVMKELGKNYHYAVQKRQLGTGHAIKCAEKLLKNKSENVLVLYCDHPFVSINTIKKLTEKHLKSGGKITLATVILPDFKNWRAFFYPNFSRIVRNKNNEIIKDVQFKDASDDEKKIREVNPCYFCFNAKWLWSRLDALKNNNRQKEYYLTDLIKIATSEGIKIESIQIKPKEALGANTREELEVLEKLAPKT